MVKAVEASGLAGPPTGSTALAVFDLDRTLVPGSSLARLARALAEARIVGKKELAGHLLRETLFAARGLGPKAIDRLLDPGRGPQERGAHTGLLAAPFCHGPGKLLRLEQVLGWRDLERATAYADSGSDLPVLRACGTPVAVNPDRALRSAATASGWPILDLS